MRSSSCGRRLPSSAFWRLLAALLLSILIHLLVLGGLHLRLPSPDMPESVIKIELASQVDKPAEAPQPLLHKTAKRKPRPTSRPVPKSVPKHTPVEAETVPPQATTVAEPQAKVEPEMTSAEDQGIQPSDAADDVPVAEPDQAEAQNAEPEPEQQSAGLVTGIEAYITSDFELRQGSNGGAAGVAHVDFRQYRDGSYSLVSTTEAKGLLSLFLRGQLIQKSEGVVTKAGLQPIAFSYVMTSKEDKSRHASFDWQSGKLRLETRKGASQTELKPGTQDLLSFIYQFVFVPPLESMEIPITNGKKLDTYSYSFEGEEELQTAIGNLRTLHLAHSSDDEERTELWLAVDYHYMPVKIRQTEENGSVIEEVITKLSTDILK